VIRAGQRVEREHERRFDLFGTSVRILVGGPAPAGEPSPELAGAVAEAVLWSCQAELTRFNPGSELSLLNADPAPARVTSKLLAAAVAAARAAAERSGGLVDPTLLGAIEAAGYAESRVGVKPASLAAAIRVAPPRVPAAPAPGRGPIAGDGGEAAREHVPIAGDAGEAAHQPAWAAIEVAGRQIRRPPGLRLDLGGTAKGFAADRAAAPLAGQQAFAVDAGGDIVVGGVGGTPRTVTVAHPLEGGRRLEFDLVAGAVATSGLGTRVWRTESGFAHHLLDPSTGRPAWTGVIQATALAASGVEAETLAKTALLSGPGRGLELLEPFGGAVVLDDGQVALAGALRELARDAA
jgi:FAD:protein FMN transferase